jgi:hypothetical protein
MLRFSIVLGLLLAAAPAVASKGGKGVRTDP